MWQQQLRFYWEHDVMDVNIRMRLQNQILLRVDGERGELVITALTDRCYITLTMGLSCSWVVLLVLRYGQDETAKTWRERCPALLRVQLLGSDELSIDGGYLPGRANGAWGCFDEFNRIVLRCCPSSRRRSRRSRTPS